MKKLLLIGIGLTGALLLSTGTTAKMPDEPRFLRVRVIDSRTERVKVNINVPLSLVRLGLRLGTRFAPELEGLDATEVMEVIKQGGHGKIVDVTDEERSERVEINAE